MIRIFLIFNIGGVFLVVTKNVNEFLKNPTRFLKSTVIRLALNASRSLSRAAGHEPKKERSGRDFYLYLDFALASRAIGLLDLGPGSQKGMVRVFNTVSRGP
jgi:hypothetical protein